MNEELIEFYEELKDALAEQAEKLADHLIEENPEEYLIGYSDRGYEDFGYGPVKLDEQPEYDEDKALLDAYEKWLMILTAEEIIWSFITIYLQKITN